MNVTNDDNSNRLKTKPKVIEVLSSCSTSFSYPPETISSFEIEKKVQLIYSDMIGGRYQSYDSNFEISNDDSYNEKVHIQQTTVLMSKYMKYFFDVNTLSNIEFVNTKINSMILSTDLKMHQIYMTIINSQHEHNSLAQMILILKLADVSHPCRQFKVHCYWVFRLMEENERAFKETLSYLAKDSLLSYLAKDSLTFMGLFVKELLMTFVDKYGMVIGLDLLCKIFNDTIRIWKSHRLRGVDESFK